MDQQLLQTGFKMALALTAVLLTFGGAVFIAKRFSGTSRSFLKRNGKHTAKPLEILAHQNLGPGRVMYLVRCLDKKILIGATNANIQHLADIADEESPELSEQFSDSLKDELSTAKRQEKMFNGNLREIARV